MMVAIMAGQLLIAWGTDTGSEIMQHRYADDLMT
jgi:hypothetical protein